MTRFRCRNPDCAALFEGSTPVDDPARDDPAYGRTCSCPVCYAVADPVEAQRVVIPRLEPPTLDDLARGRMDGLREAARALVVAGHHRRVAARLSSAEQAVAVGEVACTVGAGVGAAGGLV